MDELSYETDEVTAAQDGKESIFDSKPDVVAFVEERFSRS